ncbi:hypothetical protein MpV1_004c [Micromonas sp. RCC1109 virus MpV1]|uniref:hypothetical protein n=1 Tax=Micromonas sp. RCC1109 virus MpV1 TaxID=880161 RepID=UPI0001EF4420|nr:hypothetical protein MpV1_004c [Micromonas sp. RCC1109 virus MpV1]ADQ90927.1 hypothetical protein MpV1_004c [Micromonas sp. RCC1109 virus MpV1]
MSVNFEKYIQMIERIENGVTQLMQDAVRKSEEAIESKKELQVSNEKSMRDIENYKTARKATEEIIQTRTNELIIVNEQISEMENKIIADTQQKLNDLQNKIEEAKMEITAMTEMNKVVSKLRDMLDAQAMIKGQVY